MARLRLLLELLADYWKFLLLGVIASAYFLTVMRGWWVRHQALGVGAVACAAKGHDDTWCDDAAGKNGQECLTLTLRTTSMGRSGGMPTLQGFNTDRYIACLELGPDGWVRARKAADAAALEPLKHEHGFP